MTKAFVKKGDVVKVTTGKQEDQGRTGKVLKVLPKSQKIIIENINMRKKHIRPNPQKNIKGGIVEREMPIHCSNVKVLTED